MNANVELKKRKTTSYIFKFGDSHKFDLYRSTPDMKKGSLYE